MKNAIKKPRWKATPVQCATHIFLLTSMGWLASAAHAQLAFSSSPPMAQDSPEPPPNVILSVDDSGSMGASGIDALKNALRTAFSTANMPDGKIRLAYQAMWNNRGFGPNKQQVGWGNFPNSLRPFEGQHRTKFDAWVNTLTASGWTPSHLMMVYAGEYLRGSWAAGSPSNSSIPLMSMPANENPWLEKPGQANTEAPLACRRAYHIFMTDGAWNSINGRTVEISTSKLGGSSVPGNFDGNDHTLPDGKRYSASSPQTRIYSDRWGTNTTSTFSDLAFYYWATDLQPSILNKVDSSKGSPVTTDETFTSGRRTAKIEPYWNPKNDVATWQHMQTYTIGFNAAANLAGFDSMYGNQFAGYVTGAISWPDALRSEADRVPEMYHAAVNSRSKFYPARTAQALTDAFRDILSEISNVTALPGIASAAGSGARLNTGNMAFVATYKLDSSSGKWVGEVKGSRGNAINSAPFWAATVPAAAQRKIYTMHKNGRAVEFQWNALTAGLTAAEKTALNLGANGNLVANIRSLHLHDIVNSQIAHVGAPSGKFYGNSDYRSFFDAVRNRKHMVYVGANDGMLHGFEAGESKPSAYGSGDEKLAYIPKGLVSSLHLLTQSNYVHRYWVDGSPFVGEAQTGSGRPGGWSTILVGALGAGGKGYYILDVTEGDALTNVSDLVIADTTDSSDADLGHQFNAPVGSAYAGTSGMQPQIVQVNKRDSSGRGEWAVIMGNGYNSANGHPVLLVQSLEGSRTLYKIDPCNQVNTAICGATPVGNGDTNGLSAPRTVDVNGDGTVDIVYAGDMKGNVWKFDLGSDNTGDWKVAFNGHPLFMAKGPTGQPQPITAAPLVVVHPKGGYMLGVGTGRNLTQTDETDQNLNSFYGLYDTQSMSVGRSTGSSPVPVVTLGAGTPIPSANGTGNGRYSALFQQTAGGLSATADADGLRKGTSSTDSSVRVDGVNLRGWYFDLPDLQNNNASKVLLNPVAVSGGVVRFLSHNVSSVASGSGSTNPSDRYCKTVSVDGMKTQLNFFDLFNGNRPKSTLLVGLSGSLRPYTPDGTDKDNRFQFDATTHFLADGSDTLQGVGANLEATAVPPDVPGKRAGWRVSR